MENQYIQIGREGVEVKIAESKFGKRMYHKGRKVDGVWVFGGIKKNNCFFVVVRKDIQMFNSNHPKTNKTRQDPL